MSASARSLRSPSPSLAVAVALGVLAVGAPARADGPQEPCTSGIADDGTVTVCGEAGWTASSAPPPVRRPLVHEILRSAARV